MITMAFAISGSHKIERDGQHGGNATSCTMRSGEQGHPCKGGCVLVPWLYRALGAVLAGGAWLAPEAYDF